MNKLRNQFLVGPMSAGKSVAARHLARLLHLEFADSDEEIETRTSVDVPFIFEKEGEKGFRKREVKVIDELSQREGVVLATRGGAIAAPESRSRLGARGFMVYLHTTVRQQLERTQRGRERPLLENGDKEKVPQELMDQRDPLYREISDLIIETDGRRVQTAAREFHDAL